MNKKIYIILFVLVLSIYGNAQNKIQLEFGIGPNYTSPFLNYTKLIPNGIIESKYDYGIDVRTTISIPLNNNFTICGMLQYGFSKSKIEFLRTQNHDEDFVDSTYWDINSKLSEHDIGVSIGLKKKFLEIFSVSTFLTYKKILNRKFNNDIHTNVGLFGAKSHDIRYVPALDEYSSSVELTYYFSNRFSIVSGFMFSFTKTNYFPTEFYSDAFQYFGNKRKFYVLVCYQL